MRQLLRLSLIDQTASLSISSVARNAEDEFSIILARSGELKERSVIVETDERANDV